MGRPKKELKKIHRKKIKKAKEKVRSHLKGDISAAQLTQRAKKFFKKRKRQEKKPV